LLKLVKSPVQSRVTRGYGPGRHPGAAARRALEASRFVQLTVAAAGVDAPGCGGGALESKARVSEWAR
jgi:hypothetical protein